MVVPNHPPKAVKVEEEGCAHAMVPMLCFTPATKIITPAAFGGRKTHCMQPIQENGEVSQIGVRRHLIASSPAVKRI